MHQDSLAHQRWQTRHMQVCRLSIGLVLTNMTQQVGMRVVLLNQHSHKEPHPPHSNTSSHHLHWQRSCEQMGSVEV